MRGAIREDDIPWDSSIPEENNNPQDDRCSTDDPPKPCYRVFHHFFDPYNSRGLSFFAACYTLEPLGCQRSSDWALGVNDAFAQPMEPFSGRRNHFSLQDAREAMWRALTGKSFAAGAPDVRPITPDGAPATEAVRNAYWATTFRALGDVLHHIQDMAQPQHTRNDSHSGKACIASHCAGGHDSFYEHYIDARTRGETTFHVGKTEVPMKKSRPLTYDTGYTLPSSRVTATTGARDRVQPA